MSAQNQQAQLAYGPTPPSPTVSAIDESELQPVTSGNGGKGRGRLNQSGTADRVKANQAKLAKRAPKALINGAGGLFAAYKPAGARVEYAENKIGIMPDLPTVLQKIAESVGIGLEDPEAASRFLDALVTDVYVNPYSDKQTFDGIIKIGSFELPRVHIKSVIEPIVGTNYRRFARAMAPLIVQVMHDNYDTFGDVLDKRCGELNLSTRAEAVTAFDGADALVLIDRAASRRSAEAKALALRYRASPYDVNNSAKASDVSVRE